MPAIRILYAWELGGGLGHVSRFLPLARALRERGCEIVWALNDMAPAAVLLKDGAEKVVQAPRCPGEMRGLPEPQLAYSEVVMRYGYYNAQMLTPLLRGWRELMQEFGPDLVVTDHAPTALLAARSLGVAAARIGTGFCCPPQSDPEPPLMAWAPPGADRRAESGRIVLEAINGALAQFDTPALASLSRMHAADDDFVTTYADVDHYPERNTPRWGVILGSDGGVTPEWSSAPGPRVFAYLKAQQAQTLPLLRALRRKHCNVLAYCPGLAADQREILEAQGLRFSDRPLDIAAATGGCELVVCGGGHGTVCAALLAGRPLLIAPEMTEQAITGHNVERLGAGLLALPQQEARYNALITRLLHEPGFARAAHDFRSRHGEMTQARIVGAIADRCMELAAVRA